MLSPQEIQDLRNKYKIPTPGGGFSTSSEPTNAPGYFSRVGSSLKREGLYAGESIVRGSELMSQGLKEAQRNPSFLPNAKFLTGAGRAGLGTAASAVRAGVSPITEAVSPFISKGIDKVSDNEFVQRFASSPKVSSFLDTIFGGAKKAADWAELHPDVARNLIDTAEIAGALVGAKGVRAGAKGTVGATKAVTSKVVGQVDEFGRPIVSSVKKATAPLAREAARIPSRIKTNIEGKAVTEATIKSLPTRAARTAARDGIDPTDVKSLYSLPKSTKPEARTLFDTVRKFASGTSKKNPIEVVGKPIADRMKYLNKELGRVGQKLGKVADDLGDVTSDELQPAIMKELNKVPGMSGLKLTNGKLDFTDTVISELSKSDRLAIQKIFTQAGASGTGRSKHLLRQELFEILGGKKASRQAITATSERTNEAVRKGLANVLETKSSAYKTLSKEYAQIIDPVKKMQRILKTAGSDEDIFNMSAGLIARRLTSNAPSNPQIRALLRQLDKIGAKTGASEVSVEALQDLYNILDKYYDIAGKTSLKGQVNPFGGATGLGDLVKKTLTNVAGESVVVRQKALENMLKEILK